MSSVSHWLYKQALAGSCLGGNEVELSGGIVKFLLGMMEVFFHFLIFHYLNRVMTWDFFCVGSWLHVYDFQEFWWELDGVRMG